MRRLKRAVAFTAAALLVVPAAGCGGASNQHIVNRAQGNLKQRAVQAVVASQNTPVVACNPAVGGAKAGACAPAEALGATNALAKAAGDPMDVRKLGPVGVDTSSYQPCPYGFRGISFAVFKATEGTGYTDRCLQRSVRAAKAARRPYAVYDFLRPSFSHTASQEAQHFVSAVRAANANTSLPPVADVEANAGLNPTQLQRYVCTWHRVVRQELNRPVTITYTGYWFYKIAGDCGAPLWISAYAPFYVTPVAWRHRGARIWAWQNSNGIVGPTPHINGWDTDVWLAGTAHLARNGRFVRPPSRHAQLLCREYGHYKRMAAADHKDGRHRLSASKRARSVRARNALAHAGYSCSIRGVASRR